MKKIYFIALAALSLFSCATDDSTGAINKLASVEIADLKSEYTAMYYNQLQITPEVTLSEGADISYQWYIFSKSTSGDPKVLSEECDLDIMFTPEHADTGIEYIIVFKVIDNQTGVYYSKSSALNVSTQLTKGQLILCSRDGECYLDMLSTVVDAENPEYLQCVYRSGNDGSTLGSKATGVWALSPNPYQPLMNEVVVTLDDERGGLFLSTGSLAEWREATQAVQYATDEPFAISDYYISKAKFTDYMLVNNMICKRAVNMGFLYWEEPLVCISGESTYSAVGPEIPINGYAACFYDQKFGRIVVHNPFNFGYVQPLGSSSNGTTPFDVNNMDRDLEYVLSGLYGSADDDKYWMMMRNKQNNSYWIYRFAMEDSSVVPQDFFELTSTVAPHIAEANDFKFYFSSGYEGLIFFSTSDGVYVLNVSTLGNSSSSEAKIIDGAKAGFKISGIEVEKYTLEAVEDGDVVYTYQDQIRAYVEDSSIASGYKGGYAIYDITTTGGTTATYKSKFTGFCDYVIDLEQKSI